MSTATSSSTVTPNRAARRRKPVAPSVPSAAELSAIKLAATKLGPAWLKLDAAGVHVLAEVMGAIQRSHLAGVDDPRERESAMYGELAMRHPPLVDVVATMIDATGGAL